MRAREGVTAGFLAVACAGAAAAGPLEISPSSIPLGDGKSVELVLSGLPGRGPPAASANVGRVAQVTERDGRIHLRLDPPQNEFPQELCLVVWRRGADPRPSRVCVTLLGRTLLPVRSRPDSSVTVHVGQERFGPVTTDWRGEAKVPILVAPGTTEAQVEVTDRVGMATEKPVKIEQPRYNRLTLAVLRTGNGFRLVAAVSGADGDRPTVTVDGRDLPLRRAAAGLWERRWSPPPGFSELLITVRATLPGDSISTVERAVPMDRKPTEGPGGPAVASAAPPADGAAGKTVHADSTSAPSRPRSVHLQLGLAAGLLYNLGEVLSPQLTAEAGALYSLPRGQIGLVFSAGYSWAGQSVDGSAAGAAESSVALLPLGFGVTYLLPFGRLVPFVTAAYVLQVVTSTTRADFLRERRRVDLASGFRGLVGAGYRLGPGSVVLQAGYVWSRVENVDVRLLAGGLVVAAGYRIQI